MKIANATMNRKHIFSYSSGQMSICSDMNFLEDLPKKFTWTKQRFQEFLACQSSTEFKCGAKRVLTAMFCAQLQSQQPNYPQCQSCVNCFPNCWKLLLVLSNLKATVALIPPHTTWAKIETGYSKGQHGWLNNSGVESSLRWWITHYQVDLWFNPILNALSVLSHLLLYYVVLWQ